MKTKVFTWDNSRQDQSANIAIKAVEIFSETVNVLFITQGSLRDTVHGYTVFYTEKGTLYSLGDPVNVDCTSLAESHQFQLEMFDRGIPWGHSGYVLSELQHIEISKVQGKGLVMSLPSKHYETYTPKEYLALYNKDTK